jgi:hypothetical protein
MALNANAIVTLAEAKAQLNVVDSSMDTTIESWINESSAVIEDYTGRKFAVQSVTGEIQDGDGSRFLYPKYYPITQLSTETTPSTAQKLAALQYRDTPTSTWTNVEDEINYIFLNTNKPFIELYRKTFDVGVENIKISYKAGFSTVPSDIKKVCVEMVQMWYNEYKGGGDALGKSTSSQTSMGGNFNVTWMDVDARWKLVLDRYRTITIG